MMLREIKQVKGTYVAVKFDEDTIKSLQQYLKDNKIPNGLHPHKLHTTVLYSKKHCPDYESLGEYEDPLIGHPDELVIWETSDEEKANCLVLKYRCPDLVRRHEELMDEHNATYDYDTYHPHVTLSYDCGDLDIDQLPDVKKAIPKIIIVEEYGEDLDLDWNKKN